MYFFPFTDLVTRLLNSNMAPHSRFATAVSSCLVYATQPIQVRQQLTFPVFKISLNAFGARTKRKKTHEGQSRWCKSTIQAMSNETPQRLFSATHSRYGRRWTNCTRISNTTVHCGWIRVDESIQYMRFREKERWRCVPLYQQGMVHRLHSL